MDLASMERRKDMDVALLSIGDLLTTLVVTVKGGPCLGARRWVIFSSGSFEVYFDQGR